MAYVDDAEGWRRLIASLAQWSRTTGSSPRARRPVAAAWRALMAHSMADARERGRSTSTLQATWTAA